MNPKNHPNTLVAIGSTFGLGSFVVYAVQHWLGYTLSPQSGVYVAGVLASVALFVGRNGVVGTWQFVKRIVLHGTRGK